MNVLQRLMHTRKLMPHSVHSTKTTLRTALGGLISTSHNTETRVSEREEDRATEPYPSTLEEKPRH